MIFQKAFDCLIKNLEGDSGKPSIYGDTYGIDPGTWKDYCLKHYGEEAEITLQGARTFYYDEYWLPLLCNSIPDGLDFCVFEWAVNGEGPGRIGKAVLDLQACLGVLPDGIMGPFTVGAARDCNVQKVMVLYLARQVGWYIEDARKNPDAPLVGWENRVRKTCGIVGVDPKHVGLA